MPANDEDNFRPSKKMSMDERVTTDDENFRLRKSAYFLREI